RPAGAKPGRPDSLAQLQQLIRKADSLARVSDSLRQKVTEARNKGIAVLEAPKPSGPKTPRETVEEGTELVVRDLTNGKEWRHKLVTEYKFADFGQALVIETSRQNSDSLSKAFLLLQDFSSAKIDTIYSDFKEAGSFAFSEAGDKLAFLLQTDSSTKALKKYHRLFLYEKGKQARELLSRNTGLPGNKVVSPDFNNYFSKDGKRLYFGIAPDRRVKDTTLVDFETAKLDVWHYQDDYLQPQQLVQLNSELRKSWLSVWDLTSNKYLQLADDSCEIVQPSAHGNGVYGLGMSTLGMRIEQQWKMDGAVRLYKVELATGKRSLITARASRTSVRMSPNGKFVAWYDPKQKHWQAYNCETSKTSVITKPITVPLFREEHDMPADKPAYGLMGWKKDDEAVYIYDRYDIWEIDLTGKKAPVTITAGWGRKNKIVIRNEVLDREQPFIAPDQTLLLQLFDEKSKGYGWYTHKMGTGFNPGAAAALIQPCIVDGAVKARSADQLIFTRQTPSEFDLYQTSLAKATDASSYIRRSELNPQQADYNWFTVELHHWKMLDGKMSEGLLYKPENFDSTKKYPVIFYFYEKNADRRYNYIEPMPVRASVNIALYTSNGYLVFDPNIYYKTGQPGEDAYNSVVSAAKYLSKFRFVDSTKMGLQGHSWGGYQIAYLITRTNMFAAAEAGAPVSNMTSAYGGIRWGTGLSRQFQYEQSQSRIGATLWEKPELYLKNSPLFRADKVNTPLLMLHNDKDDAVPWYQGIEYFTALRRLGKPVWMINYNDELHGIIERRNRKDWSIRMMQFFDHYLKGAPAPKWMKEGVPATLKGIDWGLDY
ncbi:MAG TPA: prolyl oligopeptidase family serine peptidase, partial [Flavihumibacter sp.]